MQESFFENFLPSKENNNLKVFVRIERNTDNQV